MENSGFGRLIAVLTSPGKTFESIRERPTWVEPFIALCLVSMLVGFIAHQRTDYAKVTEIKMAESGQEMKAEDLDRVVTMQENYLGYVVLVLAPIALGIYAALLAFIYWFSCKMTGSEPSFKQMFAMTLYAGVPRIIAGILQAIVLSPQEVISYSQTITRNYLPAANLGMLAPDGASTKLVALLVGLDAFVLWGVVLTYIGLKVVGRMSSTAAAVVSGIVFLAGLGLRVAFA